MVDASSRMTGVVRRAASGRVARGVRRRVGPPAKRAIGRYVVPRDELDGAVQAPLLQLAHRIATLEEELDQRFARLEPLIEELVVVAQDLRPDVEALRRRVAGQETLQARRDAVPYAQGEPFAALDAPVGRVTGFRTPPSADPESPYTGFEDVFRGPPQRVTETQRPYLPLVADRAPVLDIGCGRGEFLALLAQEGIEATGVDSDPGMVARCRAAGLPAVEGDALEHLATCDDSSLGAVFSAQVIEHLPVAELHRLLALAHRKLRPDGVFIAETVNPHSPAALKTFWVDLTHQHPIFPEVALVMCGLAGFSSAYVFAPGDADFEAVRFTANSYAVVAGDGLFDG